MKYALGCLPNDSSKPRVRLNRAPGATFNPPASAGFYQDVPATAWGMLGNSTVGDCVAAGAFHAQQLIEKAGWGVDTAFTDAEALAMYSKISGYVPGNPNTDVGATLQDGLGYWRNTGLGPNAYKIDAFAQCAVSDQTLMKQCIADFGVVYLALQVPASAMTQFDQGQPWTVVSRSPIEGGHCVPGVGYDANYLYVVTWGAVQPVAWAFVTKYFQESWLPISPDLMQAAGKTPTGLDAATANADYQQLTGDTASPFPVGPTPTPTPVPSNVGPILISLLQASLEALQQELKAVQQALTDLGAHEHGH